MQAGLDGPHLHVEDLGDRLERQIDEVMQNDDSAVVEREAPEGPLELVAVVHRSGAVGRGGFSVVRRLTKHPSMSLRHSTPIPWR